MDKVKTKKYTHNIPCNDGGSSSMRRESSDGEIWKWSGGGERFYRLFI